MRNIHFVLVFLTLVACKKEVVELEKLLISDNMKGKMNNDIRELGIVYYFDGECSFCYGNLVNINERFPDIPVTMITQTLDAVLINYNLEKMGIKGKLVIDSTSILFKDNEKILNDNKLLLVNSNYDILEKAKFVMDNDIEEKFKKAIIYYNKDL